MTKKQMAAAKRIEKALNAAHAAGLMGGVYESSFCMWPIGSIDLDLAGRDFFRLVDEYGCTLYSKMRLDGGAGT